MFSFLCPPKSIWKVTPPLVLDKTYHISKQQMFASWWGQINNTCVSGNPTLPKFSGET